MSVVHETDRGTSPREGKRRVPFVRTRASVRACLRECVSARLAVTYIRARAYDLFLAGVSQPPDALFGTTRCHAPVPPLPSLALTSLRLGLLVFRPLPATMRLSALYFSLSLSLFLILSSSHSTRFLFRLLIILRLEMLHYNSVKKLDTRVFQ